MSPEEPNKRRAEWIRQWALAMDLPFLLIGATVGGGFVGYLLDTWLHTEPWLMLVLGGVGFASGLRSVLQSLAQRGKNPTGENEPGDRNGGREGRDGRK